MPGKVWVTGPDLEITLAAGLNGAVEALDGLIDTGASQTCIDRRIALALGLKAVNRKPMQMADGSVVEATSYRAVLRISELEFEDWAEVYAIPMATPSRRALIGRSFLKPYFIHYSGPDERFHFELAATAHLRSYEEHDG